MSPGLFLDNIMGVGNPQKNCELSWNSIFTFLSLSGAYYVSEEYYRVCIFSLLIFSGGSVHCTASHL